jgi:uncharacterized Tic20 family protein
MEPREKDVRTWSMLCHLSALAGFIIGLGNVLGPLIVWQIKKNELPEIIPHGKAALNFQLTILIINIIAGLGFFTYMGSSVFSFSHTPFGIGRHTLPFFGGFMAGGVVFTVINILALVFTIIAGVRANNGEAYKYPFSIRFVK